MSLVHTRPPPPRRVHGSRRTHRVPRLGVPGSRRVRKHQGLSAVNLAHGYMMWEGVATGPALPWVEAERHPSGASGGQAAPSPAGEPLRRRRRCTIAAGFGGARRMSGRPGVRGVPGGGSREDGCRVLSSGVRGGSARPIATSTTRPRGAGQRSPASRGLHRPKSYLSRIATRVFRPFTVSNPSR